jgi:hypothetical protein
MPFDVDVWVVDREDGRFTVYVWNGLVTEAGAEALQSVLNRTVAGWRRLDNATVLKSLRSISS